MLSSPKSDSPKHLCRGPPLASESSRAALEQQASIERAKDDSRASQILKRSLLSMVRKVRPGPKRAAAADLPPRVAALIDPDRAIDWSAARTRSMPVP
jgi:hypothetical protein